MQRLIGTQIRSWCSDMHMSETVCAFICMQLIQICHLEMLPLLRAVCCMQIVTGTLQIWWELCFQPAPQQSRTGMTGTVIALYSILIYTCGAYAYAPPTAAANQLV